MWAPDTPSISFGRSSGTVRGPAATRIAPRNQIALRLLGRRALAVLRGGCASDEAEPGSLFVPVGRRAGVGHQLVGIEIRRLAAMEDRLGDVGREEAEPQHPGEVGAAQAGLLGHFGYRATAAREDLLQLMGPGDQLQQAGVHLGSRSLVHGPDQEFLLHPCSLQLRRDRQNQDRLVRHGDWLAGADLLVASQDIGQMRGEDPDLQALGVQRDPGNETLELVKGGRSFMMPLPTTLEGKNRPLTAFRDHVRERRLWDRRAAVQLS